MKVSSILVAACAAIVTAIPLDYLPKSTSVDHDLVSYSDINILQFNLYQANFLNSFYREGLENFTQADFANYSFGRDFYSNLTEIASHQRTHVSSLIKTLNSLNASTVAECSYYWNVSNPAVFVNTASLLEGVTVSSYTNTIAFYKSSALATAAASVLAVEARHLSFLRAAQGLQPFPTPFETPIDFSEAYTLAELFITSCPSSNPLFKFKNFAHLSSSFSNHGAIGANITLLTFGNIIQPAAGSDQIYAAFLTASGPIFAPATPSPGLGFSVIVPKSPKGYPPISGFTYVVLTSFNTTLTDDNILAGPASLEITLG